MTRARIRFAIALCLWGAVWIWAALAHAAARSCDLALSLVFDVSSSMDNAEYGHMRDGIAASLLDPDVPWDNGNIVLQVVAFGTGQTVMVPWTPASSRADIASAIAAMPRPETRGGLTGLGYAIAFVAGQMPPCDRQVIDIAGDGESNVGPTPDVVRADIDPTIQINALATTPDAANYYRAFVMQGIGGFVHEANGFEDFTEALKQKLNRELNLS